MAKLTAEEFADKHGRRLKQSTEDIRRGVERVTEAPTLKALAKKDKMRQNFLAAMDNGKLERGLKRVSLEEWKSKMVDKGIGRIPQGIDGAREKVISFASELLPHIDRGVAKVSGMADVTLEDSINRMSEFVRHMASFKRTR